MRAGGTGGIRFERHSARLIARAQATLRAVPPPTALSAWLKAEMPRKGYPLAGPRAGGISRLADDAGISRAALSRIMSGQADPSIETLRALGNQLGYTLIEMLEFAGLIEPEERAAHAAKTDQPNSGLTKIEPDDWQVTTPPDDLWLGVNWDDLTLEERYVWHTPNTSPQTRLRLFKAVQFEREYEIQGEMERNSNDRESNQRHSNGANGA
jgi:transcriptional regulator with XRE-family HTH domain